MKIELISELNLNSPKQLANLIQNELGLEITNTTDKGNLSVGDATLKALSGQHPFVDKLNEYRALHKMLAGFLRPISRHIDPDGRIRPEFRNTVAKTGRLSCSRPNLQQLPKRKDK